MQIEHLREFLALAASANFSATAKELYITQSALSRHIAGLEEELGAKLFSRDPHGVTLTPIGRQFRSDAETLISHYERALSNVEAMRRSQEATLRIGYLYDAGRQIIPLMRPLLTETTSADGMRIRWLALEHGELMKRLERDAVDVAITIDTDPRVRDFAECEPLMPDRYFAAMPRSHPLAAHGDVTLAELAREPLILPDPYAMSGMHDFMMSQFADAGLHVEAAAYYEDIPTFMAEVESGAGAGLILGHHRHRYDEHVSIVPLIDGDTRCNVCCVWKRKTEARLPGAWPGALREAAALCREQLAAIGDA